MARLTAEEPERGGDVDGDGEGRHLRCVGGDGLETRVDTVRERLARRGEGRLRYCVVFRVVEELYRVADRGIHLVRGECETAVPDLDLGIDSRGGGGGGDGGESSRGETETHLENLFFRCCIVY